MGKKTQAKADTALAAQSGIADQTADIAKQLIDETAPARKQSLDYYSAVSKGGPEGQRAVAPQINAATQQFYLARKQAESLPPGGLRDKSLRDLSLAEAGSKTSIYSGGTAEANARLASMGWGGTQAGIGAYGTAAAGYGNVGSAYGEQASSKGGMVGSGAGAAGSIAAAAIMA
jgi:hypothetical protein